MDYKQEERFIKIKTPLGNNVLLLQSFAGTEAISRPFAFHLELLSEKKDIAFNDIVGKAVTIQVRLGDDSDRNFNGFVDRVRSGTERFQVYPLPNGNCPLALDAHPQGGLPNFPEDDCRMHRQGFQGWRIY